MKFFKISLKIFKVKNFPKIVPYLSTSLALLFLTSVLFINFEVIKLPEALAQTAGNKWVFERTSDADKLKLYYNSTAATAMTVTTAGRVGIGTSNPGTLLDVAGDISMGTAAGGAGNNKFYFAGYGNNNYYYSYDTSVTGLRYVMNGADTLFLKYTGNVGVGLTNPVGKLNVVSTTSGNRTDWTGYTLAGNFQTNAASGPAAGLVASSYTSGSTNSFGVHSNALVWNNYSDAFGGYFTGTNTTGGGAISQNVYGVYANGARNPGGSGSAYGVFANAQGSGAGAYAVFAQASGGTANYGIYSASGNNYFQGPIGIRVASPAQDLHIKQQSNSQTNAGIRLERADTTTFGTIIYGSDEQTYIFSNSNAVYCRVLTSGTMGCSSDRRQKDSIRPLQGSALDVISRLKPSTFTWKSSGARGAGFIAQEVKEVLPDAVDYSEPTGYYTVTDSYFTPYLVKGTQELNEKVEKVSERENYQYSELTNCPKEPESFTEYKACIKAFDGNCQNAGFKGGSVSNVNSQSLEGMCFR